MGYKSSFSKTGTLHLLLEVNNCLKIIFIHKFYITASCKNFFIKKNKFLK